MREFKSVFYNVWERRKREGADEEKSLLSRVEAAVAEARARLEANPDELVGDVTMLPAQENDTDATRVARTFGMGWEMMVAMLVTTGLASGGISVSPALTFSPRLSLRMMV